MDASTDKLVRDLVSRSEASELDLAAQLLEDQLGPEAFQAALRQQLQVDKSIIPDAMRDRLARLHAIPFAAILTTNYDGLLSGADAQDPAALGRFAAEVLRSPPTRFELAWKLVDAPVGTPISPVLKLHGDAERPASTLICTREGYRRLLHGGSSQYSMVLRTLMATKTLLFIGFSFTDNYLNELRSEIAAMFRNQLEAPLAYAIMSDVPQAKVDALARHDRLQVISFSTAGGDFSGFDVFLRKIYHQTNPTIQIGHLMHQRRILWLAHDWSPMRSVTRLFGYLCNANARAWQWQTGSRQNLTCQMTQVSSVEEAVVALSDQYDVVVSVFDSDHLSPAATMKLLQSVQMSPNPAPVIVTGGSTTDYPLEARRSEVMRKGALCYISNYWKLLEQLCSVLEMAAQAELAASSFSARMAQATADPG